MDSLFLLFIFILGTIVGSFVNVVSFRYNTGMSSAKGRSKCFSCNLHLKWYELVPVFSFLFLGGKCSKCKSSISFQYPVFELLSGILFVGLAVRGYMLWPVYSTFEHGLLYSVLFFLYYAFIFSLLLVILSYDIRHKIIPNQLVYTFVILGVARAILFMYCNGFSVNAIDALDILSPFILSAPLALLWLVSRGKWIGLGDAKLVFGMGLLLGLAYGASAVILAFWIGAVWSIYIWFLSRARAHSKVTLQSEIPFAPFLILATIIVFFTHIDVLGLGNFLHLIYQV